MFLTGGWLATKVTFLLLICGDRPLNVNQKTANHKCPALFVIIFGAEKLKKNGWGLDINLCKRPTSGCRGRKRLWTSIWRSTWGWGSFAPSRYASPGWTGRPRQKGWPGWEKESRTCKNIHSGKFDYESNCTVYRKHVKFRFWEIMSHNGQLVCLSNFRQKILKIRPDSKK